MNKNIIIIIIIVIIIYLFINNKQENFATEPITAPTIADGTVGGKCLWKRAPNPWNLIQSQGLYSKNYVGYCNGSFCSVTGTQKTPGTGQCLECVQDGICTNNPKGKYCSNNKCVSCVLDSHCSSGYTCTNNKCVEQDIATKCTAAGYVLK